MAVLLREEHESWWFLHVSWELVVGNIQGNYQIKADFPETKLYCEQSKDVFAHVGNIDIPTELLNKKLSPGKTNMDSCGRRKVLTFFLSEV